MNGADQIGAAVAAGLPENKSANRTKTASEDQAILLLAMLSGGVTLARAVSDPALSERIAEIIEQAALTLGSPSNP